MKLRFLINTHERPKMLHRLLWQLEPQVKPHDTKFYIQNDGSLQNYDHPVAFFNEYLDGQFVRYPRKHGKLHYWRLVNELFKRLEGDDFDYAFKLDDDIEVAEDFVERIIEMFEAIDNDAKVALNPFTCKKNEGAQQWTPIPAEYEEHEGFKFYKVGWVDMVWLATPRFFEALGYRIKPIDPQKLMSRRGHSSGVGRQISRRIARKNWALYQCKHAQVYHGKHESKMHEKRRNNGHHLVTNNYEQ